MLRRPHIPAALLLALSLFAPVRGDTHAPVRAEAYFSPDGGARQRVIELLDAAQAEIRCALYLLSSPQLADRIAAAHRRGVDVRVLLDRKENHDTAWSMARSLERRGVPVAYVRPEGKPTDPVPACFHHKFCVLDRAVVVTGSFNWSNMADTSNHENLLVLRSRTLARDFLEAFARAEALASPRVKKKKKRRKED